MKTIWDEYGPDIDDREEKCSEPFLHRNTENHHPAHVEYYMREALMAECRGQDPVILVAVNDCTVVETKI